MPLHVETNKKNLAASIQNVPIFIFIFNSPPDIESLKKERTMMKKSIVTSVVMALIVGQACVALSHSDSDVDMVIKIEVKDVTPIYTERIVHQAPVIRATPVLNLRPSLAYTPMPTRTPTRVYKLTTLPLSTKTANTTVTK